MKKILSYYICSFTILLTGAGPLSIVSARENLIAQANCPLVEYKEQLTRELYLIDSQDKQQGCILNTTLDQKVSLATNDPGYPNQWALKNTGQVINGLAGLANFDVGFEEAYPKIANIPQGYTKIAIIDTGISSIPDLSGQLSGGYNAIQDNGNAADDNGHGTFLASIIGASSNNAQGIAGINHKVKLIPVKVLGADGTGSLSDLIKGIAYAIDQKVHIINLSMTTSNYTPVLNEVLAEAYQQGILVVAASGNEGNNLSQASISPLHNDGNRNFVLGVGSVNNRGSRSNFANDGFGVDILSPGEDILGINHLNNLQYRSGTSISTAVVSGILASWRDYYGSLNPQEALVLINSSSQSRVISMSNAMLQRDYPNGALVRSAQSGVYLIRQGVKRPITDPTIFLSYHYKWNDILLVSQNNLDSIPTGIRLPLREGSLIADNDKVYVIENGLKRPFASPQAFLGLAYRWGNIIKPSQFVLDSHPTGDVVAPSSTPLEGSVVTAPGRGAYLIENGMKKPFVNPYTFLTRYAWQDLQVISNSVLDSFITGSAVNPQEGSIIRDNRSVYWVEGNLRRPFASPQAFLGLGLTWDKVVFPDSVVLANLSVGNIIQ